MVARDKAVLGECKLGFFRLGVKNKVFDTMVKDFEGQGSCDVTRRRLSLGARDGTTGWRAKTFTEDTVKAIYIPRSSSQMALKVGTYVRTDVLLIVAAGFNEGDEVKTSDGKYYEVKAVREHRITPDNFSHRELDLTYLPLHV